MQVYKLTNAEGYTRGRLKWDTGVTHSASGKGNEPCSSGVIHAYLSPEIAMFCNPIHANVENPRMWVAEMNVTGCDGLKIWGKNCTTLREIPVLEISTKQRVEIAIRTAMVFYREARWVAWAENWLSGKNRSGVAAKAEAKAWRAATAAKAWQAATAAKAWQAAAAVAEAEAWRAVAAAKARQAAAAAAAEEAWRAAFVSPLNVAEAAKSFNIGLHFLICEVLK